MWCCHTAAMPPADRAGPGTQQPAWRSTRPGPLDVVDVLVYVVVLNLAIQYIPSVLSETFTLSLLTAVLLKLVLELVLLIKGRLLGRMRAAATRRGKVAGGVTLWLVAVGSKFLVLELVALVFRGSVELGGFIPVSLLIVTLLTGRAVVRRYFVPGTALL